ncbi:MAG: hypothetical protein EHM40_02975 [Chloroflexi bacterium]|nr:MAG: hypothetical protein EHM40_02975 [Chloroflexota bacterium]
MKISESGNAILPNTFQHPNIFIDRLMYYLTPEENVVLTFAVRRILGFQENISSRKDNISLSQFVEGVKSTKDGSDLSKGCGLKTGAVRRALYALYKFNILLPTTDKADPRRGQEYWLQDNEKEINWDLLEKRLAEQEERERVRTEKARSVVPQHTQKESEPVVPQHPTPVVPQQTSVLSDNNTKPRETQGNTLINSDRPALEIFRGYFGKFLSEKELLRWMVIYEAAGEDQAEELLQWAFKKEIHLMNRAGLLDSLETAVKNWKEKPSRSNGKRAGSPVQPELTGEELELARARADEMFGGMK